jgi:hypothetical protein
MIASTLAPGLALLLAWGAAPAMAEAAPSGPFAQGRWVLSAERLFGATWSQTESISTSGQSRAEDHLGLSLFRYQPSNLHMRPRLALDFAPFEGATVGGSMGFTVGRQAVLTEFGPLERPPVTHLSLSPRAGYGLNLGSKLTLWLRGGATYFHQRQEFEGETLLTTTFADSGLSVDLEPTLLFSPVPHVGLTAGLLANLPLWGSRSRVRTDGSTSEALAYSRTLRNVGLVFGMAALF